MANEHEDLLMQEFQDDGQALPPLADVVFGDMLANEQDAGLAAFVLINAVLLDSGDKLISRIVKLNPQRVDLSATERGYRVDIEAISEDNAITIFELQLGSLMVMNERALILGQKALSRNAQRGQDWREVAQDMPRVIAINIMDFNLRKTGKNFHQVAEFVYREKPREVAVDLMVVHDIQLPRFRKAQINYKNPLHCILKALVDAQDKRLTLKEVVDVNNQLARYAAKSPGFQQLIDRHQLVNASPQARQNYFVWANDQMLYTREIVKQREEAAAEAKVEGIEEGIGIGRTEGIGIGEQRGRVSAATDAIKRGLLDTVMVSAIGGFSEDRARELIAQYAQK
ncbi:transposase [Clostridia bacterium]|nr:transposase [Clostridia bacterium]